MRCISLHLPPWDEAHLGAAHPPLAPSISLRVTQRTAGWHGSHSISVAVKCRPRPMRVSREGDEVSGYRFSKMAALYVRPPKGRPTSRAWNLGTAHISSLVGSAAHLLTEGATEALSGSAGRGRIVATCQRGSKRDRFAEQSPPYLQVHFLWFRTPQSTAGLKTLRGRVQK